MIEPAVGFIWFLAFLFSTTVHEAMHAWAAMKGGDPTAYHGGQVSLSPIPHIKREPIGMLVLPLLTALTQGWAIGWASAPYDPHWAARYPRRAALMAAAGPLGNLMLAARRLRAAEAGTHVRVVRRAVVGLVRLAGTGRRRGSSDLLASLLSIFLMLNVLLFTFNLLPLPPLDGSAVLALVLPGRQAQQFQEYATQPWLQILGLVIAWKVFPFISGPLFLIVLRLLHPGESYGSTGNTDVPELPDVELYLHALGPRLLSTHWNVSVSPARFWCDRSIRPCNTSKAGASSACADWASASSGSWTMSCSS